MDKSNLARTYIKKPGVRQTIEELSRGPPQPLMKPPSAGGKSDGPSTLSQEYLQFVDGIDEVPAWIRDAGWAIITRMNALTYVDSDDDFERVMHGVRSMLREMLWTRKITLGHMNQIEYYVGLQLRKSKRGKERTLIAPGYQDITHREGTVQDSLVEERQSGNANMGFVSKLKRSGF